jgi:hypothetical protein
MRRLRRREGVGEWRQEKKRYDRGECLGSHRVNRPLQKTDVTPRKIGNNQQEDVDETCDSTPALEQQQ